MGISDSAIVEFHHVTKRHDGGSDAHPALDDISLSVREGEIFGVIGESGAGKTTLLELINALSIPTSGSLTVQGVDVSRLNRAGMRRLRQGIGVLFQGIHLLSNRTVRGNVALPLQLARRTADPRLSRVEERTAIDEILSFVGLSNRAEHFPAQLSGGERQRVGLARALVGRPALLLCDEPTSSLDASTTADVLKVLADAREKLGTTVVVISHDLDVVKAICDRAALLEHGRLLELFTVAKTDYRTMPTYHEQVKRELMP